jgi:hypothetical protein
MTSGFGNRTGEILPVRGWPRRNVGERLRKAVWRLLQRSQAKLTVEAYLSCSSSLRRRMRSPAIGRSQAAQRRAGAAREGPRATRK